MERLVLDLLKDFLIALPRKGGSGSGNYMQEDSKSPHIASLIIVLVKNLRRNIIGSPHYLISTNEFHLFLHVVLPLKGQTKVDQSYIIVFCPTEEEVLSFQVPVADFLQMQIFDCLDHLGEDATSPVLVEASAFVDPVEELSPLAETK